MNHRASLSADPDWSPNTGRHASSAPPDPGWYVLRVGELQACLPTTKAGATWLAKCLGRGTVIRNPEG